MTPINTIQKKLNRTLQIDPKTNEQSQSIGKLLCLFLILFNLLYTRTASAIVNGIDIQNNEKSFYVGLDFKIKGPSPVDPCSGTYLGKGKLLTAAHCFLLNEYATEDLTICIYDIQKTNKLCVNKNDFEVSFPPVLEWGGKAPTRKTRTVVRIPKPDLAILKLKTELVSKLEFLIPVKLSTPRLSSPSENDPEASTFIVGQGCTNYASLGEEVLGMGAFRTGITILAATPSEVEWTSLWSPESPNGGVCWGDSGGALMESRFGQVTQAGVISAMKTKHDPKTGRPAVVTSFYGRLDNVVVQKWLFQILGE